MSKLQIFIATLFCFSFWACQKDDIILPTIETKEEKQDDVVLSVNAKMNIWAYNQMKHHYLYYEDMPDSTSLDFETDFDTFYTSLKSPKDRFSYYTTNDSYKGSVVACLSKIDKNIKDNDCHTGTRSYISSSSVEMVKILNVVTHKVGYIKYAEYEGNSDLREAFRILRDSTVTDLVVDLRDNGGGYVSTAMYLCSLIMPEEDWGKDAMYLRYNDKVTKEMREKEGKDQDTYTFDANGKLRECNLNLHKVYFLVNNGTASASESTINCLRPYMDVIVIGQTTVGKGTGMYSISDDNYRYTLVPLTFRCYNIEGRTVPDTGIVPDYIMSDTTGRITYGSPDEPYLAKALELIEQEIQN